jgi:hypothetical protein
MKPEKSSDLKFFLNKKYEDFISDYEDKWLQYASAEQRMKAFFGDANNANELFKKWQRGEDIFAKERAKAFSLRATF